MKHHLWITDKFSSVDLTALRDFHTMPEVKPRKTMSQKNEERAELHDAEDAYINAGGIIEYRDTRGNPVEPQKPTGEKPE